MDLGGPGHRGGLHHRHGLGRVPRRHHRHRRVGGPDGGVPGPGIRRSHPHGRVRRERIRVKERGRQGPALSLLKNVKISSAGRTGVCGRPRKGLLHHSDQEVLRTFLVLIKKMQPRSCCVTTISKNFAENKNGKILWTLQKKLPPILLPIHALSNSMREL